MHLFFSHQDYLCWSDMKKIQDFKNIGLRHWDICPKDINNLLVMNDKIRDDSISYLFFI